MAERLPTRAELIERIKSSSKDAVVLAEMQRLGYWPKGELQPTPEAAVIERETELIKALSRVQSELHRAGNAEQAMKELRKERMQLALQKREVTAQAREKRRFDQAVSWQERSKTELHYLGTGASAGLEQVISSNGGLATPLALAEAMGISLAELRFLCFHREVGTTSHYRRFALPKKTGGERIISAPMPRLKRAQYWVLDNLLANPKSPVACHDAAHGFMAGRSIVSNAVPHAGKAVVINLDLQNFFPSIKYPRIKGVFGALGYSEAVATVLALLCTENVCDELVVDGAAFFVGHKAHERCLPQGAPTSPMITNILCRRLDKRLSGMARKLGFVYTRYADDLSFSSDADANVGKLLRQLHFIVKAEGFTPHPTKQQVMRRGERHEVTGVVVNAAPGVARNERRKLRAALYTAEKKGLEHATWRGLPASKNTLLGYAHFVSMVSSQQGAELLAKARALGQTAPVLKPKSDFRKLAAAGRAPLRPQGAAWWQPAAKAAPVLLKTAGQIKAERQARINAERAGRNKHKQPGVTAKAQRQTERSSAAAASSATAATPDVTTPLLPTPWLRLGLQLLLLIQIAYRLKSAPIFLMGSLLLAFMLLKRQFGWPVYLIGMLVVVGIGLLFK